MFWSLRPSSAARIYAKGFVYVCTAGEGMLCNVCTYVRMHCMYIRAYVRTYALYILVINLAVTDGPCVISGLLRDLTGCV